MPNFSIEQKLAQLFLVGSDSANLSEELEPFYPHGLGGLILFRHHTQPFSSASDLKAMLAEQTAQFKGPGLTFISIDQEGGQVERIPHWYFPTGILPVDLGMKQNVALCHQINSEVARRLRWLGFNLNFTPTVDLNRERKNPIIGVRAYGQNPNEVIPFADAVIKAHMDAGVIPCAKHFPGHGSGTVDSHHDLPIFESWQEDELIPFESLIKNDLPSIMVAHGIYPQLTKQLGVSSKIPASLSPGIITQLLRNRMRYNGLVFTDDLTMGAVWNESDPAEVALSALEAGADMLVYRRAQPEAWHVFEVLLSRLKQGKLDEQMIDEKLSRVLNAKALVEKTPVPEFSEKDFSHAICHHLSLEWVQATMTEIKHQFISPLPLNRDSQWGLVYPNRESMLHYNPDRAQGMDLLEWLMTYGLEPTLSYSYPVFQKGDLSLPSLSEHTLQTIVFIAFNGLLDQNQQMLYQAFKHTQPQAKMILVSCAMPTDSDVMPEPWVHLALPGFRPAAMEALSKWLASPPQ